MKEIIVTTISSVAEQTVSEEAAIATPALLVDLAKTERNVQRLATYVADHGLGLRPHIKTHKSLRMAALQTEAGVVGLTVAKVGEAEVMDEAHDDLLLAYPALDPARTGRIAALGRQRTVRVSVDSGMAADALADAARSAGSTLGILVDLDVGMGRTGLQSPQDTLDLAQHVDRTTGLRLDGLFCYPGHVNGLTLPIDEGLKIVQDQLNEALGLWQAAGLEARIVSGGSTPTARYSHLVPALTEIRPGTYIYYDWNCAAADHCDLGDCAASVVCTVVSDAVPGKMVIDAGNKTLASDRNALEGSTGNGSMGYGRVVEYPDARIFRLSEEHGDVDLSKCDSRPALGERVHVIPNHICPCVNLQDRFWLRHPDGTFSVEPVDARGRLS